MALGSLVNTPWILAFALCGFKKSNPQINEFYTDATFISLLIILLSVLNGFGQAIQWVGQGKYISDCATEDTKGFFFGYFWIFYMASQIVGSLVAALTLNSMRQEHLFIILGVISFVSSLSFFFMRKPNVHHRLNQTTLRQESPFEIQPDGKPKG